MVIDWLAAGVDPARATLFIQSRVPEHAELHPLLSMITPLGWLERVPTYKDQQEKLADRDLATYGFLGYPLLQSADILIYRAAWVPVGEDQVPHVELTREMARRFNHIYGREPGFEDKAKAAVKKLGSKKGRLYNELRTRYQEQGDEEALEAARALLNEQQNLSMGDRERLFGYLEGGGRMILAEPQALLTEASKLPGLDGQKMSKSYNNTITLREDAAAVTKKIRTMPTDPARVKRTDPGDPEKCPVWQLHLVYSDDTTRALGAAGLQERRHRLPRMQAAGDPIGAGGTGADARAGAALPGRSDPGAQHHRRRLRKSARARGRDHARRARSDGIELLVIEAAAANDAPLDPPAGGPGLLPSRSGGRACCDGPRRGHCSKCRWICTFRRMRSRCSSTPSKARSICCSI